MFGSVALDVVIGLVFIYLIYSLLATILSEIIAVSIGLRARNLEQAIYRMLEGESEKTRFKAEAFIVGIINTIKLFFYKQREGRMLRAFYDHPLIDHLSENKFFSKPDYLTREAFSKVILDILKDKGQGSTEVERVQYTLKHNNISTGNSGENGITEEDWNTIKTSVEEKDIGRAYYLLEKVAKDKLLLNPKTKELIVSFLNDAQNDLVKFRYLLEQWFEENMSRSTGWYKRKVQIILLLIGFGLAVVFNASTITIVDILSKDDDARAELVALATAYVENNPVTVSTGEQLDSADAEVIQDKLDSLLAVKKELQQDVEEANQILGLGWTLPDSLETQSYDSLLKDDELGNRLHLPDLDEDTAYYYVEIPKGNDLAKVQEVLYTNSEGTSEYVYFHKWEYRWEVFKESFWGYILTALAITLGAPFWFDLLNKLVQLRSTPQAKSQPPPSSSNSLTTTTTVPPPYREG
ncbi:MAG: hypothetical protein AAF944_01075 [Bacteroidota bacterium]